MIRNAGNGQPNMTAWHVVDVRLDPVHQPSVGTFETREASPQVAVRNARSPGREVGLWGCATSESSEKHYGTELQWVSWSPSHQKAYARSERPKKDGFSMFSNYPSRHRIFGCIRGIQGSFFGFLVPRSHHGPPPCCHCIITWEAQQIPHWSSLCHWQNMTTLAWHLLDLRWPTSSFKAQVVNIVKLAFHLQPHVVWTYNACKNQPCKSTKGRWLPVFPYIFLGW